MLTVVALISYEAETTTLCILCRHLDPNNDVGQERFVLKKWGPNILIKIQHVSILQ